MMEFVIEWVSNPHYGIVVARALADEVFELYDDSQLSGSAIHPQSQWPQTHNFQENQTSRSVAFYLKDKKNVRRFKIGEVVRLSRADPPGDLLSDGS